MLRITILTLFPEMFQGPFAYSIVKRASEKNLVEINFVNIREFGIGIHRSVDDTPYGGGIGMIMRVDVLQAAIAHAKKSFATHDTPDTPACPAKPKRSGDTLQRVVLLSASGITYSQQKARDYSQLKHLIIICGHYEGVDERIKKYIDEEISLGDFITTGGEIPAMLIVDSIARLIPGVLKDGAVESESFSLIAEKNNGTLLEYPHYTKPPLFEKMPVPEILLSGNHKKIGEWRLKQAHKKTQKIRPDLLKLK